MSKNQCTCNACAYCDGELAALRAENERLVKQIQELAGAEYCKAITEDNDRLRRELEEAVCPKCNNSGCCTTSDSFSAGVYCCSCRIGDLMRDALRKNPERTKLRLRAEQAERERDEAHAKYEATEDQLLELQRLCGEDGALYRHRAEQAEARVREVGGALGEMVRSAEAYMEYHAAKFYSDSDVPKPTGLWPAIKKARAELEADDDQS